jgi:lipopolysaccharide export system permease protein
MRLLDRYIVWALGRYIALSMAVLLVLMAVFLFVNEQGWTGAGEYGQLHALRYVLAQLPVTALQFLPVAALLGALLAMGQLARGSELTIMRAAGVSVARIAGSVSIAGLLLVPVAFAAGEWLAPQLAQSARVSKALARNGSIGLSQGAAWSREGELLLRAGGNGSVSAFELDAAGRLVAVAAAAGARQASTGGWELLDVAESRFDAAGVRGSIAANRPLPIADGSDLLQLGSADPRQQSLATLWSSISSLEARGQDATRQRFALWSGLARLVAIPLAMLLALPLLLGALRRAEGGARATVGLLLGLLYFILQRTVESGTLAFRLDPLLLAWLPTLLLGAAVGILLRRTQRISAA